MKNGDIVAFDNNPLKPIYKLENVSNGRAKLRFIEGVGYAQSSFNGDNEFTEKEILDFGVIIELKPTTWKQILGDIDG